MLRRSPSSSLDPEAIPAPIHVRLEDVPASDLAMPYWFEALENNCLTTRRFDPWNRLQLERRRTIRALTRGFAAR